MQRSPPNKRKLSPLTITKLRPRAHTFLVWDTLERGLAVQIRSSGHRSFKFVYHYKGRSRWFHIGAADAVSLASARQEATRLRLEVHQGKDPATERRASSAASTTATFRMIPTPYVTAYPMPPHKSWRHTLSP